MILGVYDRLENEGEPSIPPLLRKKAIFYQDISLRAVDASVIHAIINCIFPGRGVLVSSPTLIEERNSYYAGPLSAFLKQPDIVSGLLHENELRVKLLSLASSQGLISSDEAECRAAIWKEKPSPEITQAILDIDGTLLGLKYNDPYNTSFTNSEFGGTVIDNFGKLIDECISNDVAGIDKTNILTQDPIAFIRNKDVCSYLEAQYGGKVTQEMRQEFCRLFGKEQGEAEYQNYLSNHPQLPFAYHIFRWMTHGKVDIDTVFEKPDNSTSQFVNTLIEEEVQTVFLTASPRIHALRMLEKAGLFCEYLLGKISLITVEDLYDPFTLKEMSKSVAIAACTLEEEGARKAFDRIANSSDKAQKMYEVYLRLKSIRGRVVSPTNTVSVGDQWESDIDPTRQLGVYAYLVNGPHKLPDILKYCKSG